MPSMSSSFRHHLVRLQPDQDSSDTPDMSQMPRWTLLALLGWWSVRFITHPLDGELVGSSFLHLVNLVFHEAGHVLLAPFGSFFLSLGGSLLQLLVPVVCAVSFLKREDVFAAWVCGWWAGQSLVDLAPYIADARALQLVLLGGFTGAEVEGHDWEAILSALGWLHLDRTFGHAAHVIGSGTMVTAIGGAAWTTWQMHVAAADATPRSSPARYR